MGGNARIMMKRPNYVVADLDRALELYCGILGLELDHRKTSAVDSYSYACFAIRPGIEIRFAALSAPGQVRCLALTEVRGQPIQKQGEPRDHGVVFNVDRLDEIQAALRAGGYTLMPEGKLVTSDGSTGREQGFLDRDGHLIVLYQLD